MIVRALIVLLICFATALPVTAQQTDAAKQQLLELMESWRLPESDSFVETTTRGSSIEHLCACWKRGRHMLLINADLERIDATSGTLQQRVFMVNRKYCALIERYNTGQTDLRQGPWEIKMLLRSDNPEYRQTVAKEMGTAVQDRLQLGWGPERMQTVDDSEVTLQRQGDVDVYDVRFTYDTGLQISTRYHVRDGQFVKCVSSCDERPWLGGTTIPVSMTKWENFNQEGSLTSTTEVEFGKGNTGRHMCYLSYYGLKEPDATPWFRPWMIGAACVALLATGVGVQKLRGQPLWSGGAP